MASACCSRSAGQLLGSAARDLRLGDHQVEVLPRRPSEQHLEKLRGDLHASILPASVCVERALRPLVTRAQPRDGRAASEASGQTRPASSRTGSTPTRVEFTRMSSSAPRTLADQFRSWPDERLSALLDARPDLAAPAPHDSSQLAARVVVKTSVLRALDALDALELTVLQALVQGTDPADLPATPAAVDRAMERLESLALVWGSPRRPVLVVGDLLRLPAGPPTDEVPEPAGRAGRSGAGDPRPPRRDRCERTVERWRRDRRPTWWPPACSSASTSGT